jgi:hypothetical protein
MEHLIIEKLDTFVTKFLLSWFNNSPQRFNILKGVFWEVEGFDQYIINAYSKYLTAKIDNSYSTIQSLESWKQTVKFQEGTPLDKNIFLAQIDIKINRLKKQINSQNTSNESIPELIPSKKMTFHDNPEDFNFLGYKSVWKTESGQDVYIRHYRNEQTGKKVHEVLVDTPWFDKRLPIDSNDIWSQDKILKKVWELIWSTITEWVQKANPDQKKRINKALKYVKQYDNYTTTDFDSVKINWTVYAIELVKNYDEFSWTSTFSVRLNTPFFSNIPDMEQKIMNDGDSEIEDVINSAVDEIKKESV